jgi:phenylacetate-CoA ligase
MIYNKLLENLLLPIGDWIFRSNFIQSLKQVREETTLSENALQEIQKKRLLSILEFAAENSAYYKGIIPCDNYDNPYEKLQQIPILTKAIIKKNTIGLLTSPKNKLIKLSSSGSTGEQTDVYLSNHEISIDRAIQTHWWEWAGYKIGMPMLQTGLATSRSFEKKLKDYFFRTKYLFAFGLTHEDFTSVTRWISHHKPFLGGYASSLYVISQLLEDNNLNFNSSVSWGDKLFDHYKKNITENLGCQVFETYGTGEGIKIAAQKDNPYMYIMTPYVFLEILDDEGNPVPDGTMGNIVVTSLVNRAMPLIRYRLGDLAIKLPKEKYPKDRSLDLPLLQKVIGRETDIIKTPYGRKLIVHSFTGVFEYYPQIKQFCIIQKKLSGIHVLYIKDHGFHARVLNEISNKLATLIKEPFEITFEAVEHIPPTQSGKPQIIISHLQNYNPK